MDQYDEFHAAVVMWRYVSPSILVIGTGGNLLSLMVLTRKPLRGSSTMLYLTVLAAVDLAVLYTGLLRLYLQYAHGYNLRTTSNAACKIHSFLVYFLLDFSVWLIALVTADRCIHVVAPFRGKRVGSLRTAWVLVLVVAVVLALINCHLLWTATLRNVDYWGGGLACDHHPDYEYFMTQVWPKIDLVVFFGLPFTVMLISNMLIIRTFTRSSSRLRRHTSRMASDPGEGVSGRGGGKGATNTRPPHGSAIMRVPSIAMDSHSGRRHSTILEEPEAERVEAVDDSDNAENKGDNSDKDKGGTQERNDIAHEERNEESLGHDGVSDDGQKEETDDVFKDSDATARNEVTTNSRTQTSHDEVFNGHIAFRAVDDVIALNPRRAWWKRHRKVGDVSQGQSQLPSQGTTENGRFPACPGSATRNQEELLSVCSVPACPGSATGNQEELLSVCSVVDNQERSCNGNLNSNAGQDEGQSIGVQGRVIGRRQSRGRLTSDNGGGRPTSWVTVTLLVMSAVFLVLTAPVVIYLIGFELAWSRDPNLNVQAQLTLAWAVTNILQYSNSAATFFLYCMTGPRFRRELVALFSCRKDHRQEGPVPRHSRHLTHTTLGTR